MIRPRLPLLPLLAISAAFIVAGVALTTAAPKPSGLPAPVLAAAPVLPEPAAPPLPAAQAEAPPATFVATPSRFVDVPVEDSGNLEDSLPPLDVESAENEAANSDRRVDFVFPESALASLPVAEVGKTAFPGDKEFIEAVESLPPGLKDKLKTTIGADFTALRPIPAGKLRRPL